MRGINSEGVMKEITASISSKLSDVGIMFRLFSRAKSQESLKKKLGSDSDYGNGKKLQDLIGVRVVLYFNDDIDTEIVGVYFEGFSKLHPNEGKIFLETLKSMKKPVLFMNGGNTECVL